MAVASGTASLDALRALVGEQPVPASVLLHGPGYLPEGISASPDPTRMDPGTLVGGYGNEARYRLHDDPALAATIAGPPASVLSERPSIESGDVAAFVTRSLDLTMQGGTTSGVVYPLAVCELATGFRFRNVGGASAGAIAAAITAAAELGRSELARHPERGSGAPAATALSDPVPGRPRVRAGFVGLTDVISWLTQIRPEDRTTDEFRLAQLFRPGGGNQRLFRVVIAAMRRRTWALPLLALAAFRWPTQVVAAALIVGTVLLTGWIGGLVAGTAHSPLVMAGWGLLDSATFVATVVALALLAQGVPRAVRRWGRRDDQAPAWLTQLRTTTSSRDVPRVTVRQQLIAGAVLLGVVVAMAVIRPLGYGTAVGVGLAGSFVLLLTLLASAFGYLGRLRSSAFGLLAGTAPRARRRVLDRLAGVPEPTVDQSVVPWLNDCLTALAGLPAGEVLRFGHLWSGDDFHRIRLTATPDQRAVWQAMSERTDERLVNLELMTTDLTRQRPYRFPLPRTERDSPDQLWLCLDQLREGDTQLFPEAVLSVLAEGTPREVIDRAGARRTVHPLPDPWDLPVIVAVRLSMALPVLFQAVRMYRLVTPIPVQDDFGRALYIADSQLAWPPVADLADEVWFSDGGITSNFPVHFFDASLPRWPTVSLNLGRHPEWAPHQDVSLPQDWDVANAPVEPLTDSGVSLAKGVFRTAMAWRDTMQSAMPGYRNRIAQVRTRAGEGGTNLFMPREAVASLALRGALAGARLRTRFTSTDQWNRFRWLRLRVAVSNLERLRRSTEQRQGFYSDALGGPRWLDEQRAKFCDQPAGVPIPWYRPEDSFWPEAPEMLEAVARCYQPPPDHEDNPMTTNVPLPEPVLRQVPQE